MNCSEKDKRRVKNRSDRGRGREGQNSSKGGGRGVDVGKWGHHLL